VSQNLEDLLKIQSVSLFIGSEEVILFFYWTTTSKPASALDWTTGEPKLAGFAQNPECLTEVCLFYWFRRRHSLLLLDSGFSNLLMYWIKPTGEPKLGGFAEDPECLAFYWLRGSHSLLLLVND
jgi:hypothetical protein